MLSLVAPGTALRLPRGPRGQSCYEVNILKNSWGPIDWTLSTDYLANADHLENASYQDVWVNKFFANAVFQARPQGGMPPG